MRRKFFQRLRRAVPAQIARRCHHHHLRIFQLARDQRRIVRRAATHRQVVGVVGKVDIAVADMHVDLDFRIALAEGGQYRQHAVVRVRRRQADAQPPGGRGVLAADLPFGVD
ncbi:hypothetical protein D3C72_1613480 [compost metagenome]